MFTIICFSFLLIILSQWQIILLQQLSLLNQNSPTWQSSDYYDCTSSYAVDGNYSRVMNEFVGHCGCAHVSPYATPPSWWVVDLQAMYFVQQVSILTRSSHANRYNNMTFYASMQEFFDPHNAMKGMTPYAYYDNVLYNGEPFINISSPDGVLARYIMIQSSLQCCLTLCEVQIYGIQSMFVFKTLLLANILYSLHLNTYRCLMDEATAR